MLCYLASVASSISSLPFEALSGLVTIIRKQMDDEILRFTLKFFISVLARLMTQILE